VEESYAWGIRTALEGERIEAVDTLLKQGEAHLRGDSLLLAQFFIKVGSDLYEKGILNQAKALWEQALAIAEAALSRDRNSGLPEPRKSL
jgi:hypothetical protein